MPGRAAIESGHRALFEGPLKGSKLTGNLGAETKVRFVRPDVAIAVVGGGSSLMRRRDRRHAAANPPSVSRWSGRMANG